MATWKQIIIANFILGTIREKKTSIHVNAFAKFLDERIDEQFGSKSEEIQKAIVSNILLPLAEKLMEEQYDEYLYMLDEIRKGD